MPFEVHFLVSFKSFTIVFLGFNRWYFKSRILVLCHFWFDISIVISIEWWLFFGLIMDNWSVKEEEGRLLAPMFLLSTPTLQVYVVLHAVKKRLYIWVYWGNIWVWIDTSLDENDLKKVMSAMLTLSLRSRTTLEVRLNLCLLLDQICWFRYLFNPSCYVL